MTLKNIPLDPRLQGIHQSEHRDLIAKEQYQPIDRIQGL